ncbi:YciI family protein [Kribbella sp. NPDC051770]|uniref:YciI family protein n=1 Tax=Kribbella sp. NPDC051770 TaxID=3155413 RepID=UPI00343517DD
MKYVVLIYSSPQPWGHPTGDFMPEHQALPQAERDQLNSSFETVLSDLQSKGELLGGEALGDPATAKLYRWSGRAVVTDGPYSESKEHLAGLFLIDVSPERAEEVGQAFAGPGETVEIRPIHSFE